MEKTAVLGTIPNGSEPRDAVHVAIIPAVAGTLLHPATPVVVRGGLAWSCDSESVGIVDPFLKDVVAKGDNFWLVLYPGSITSLRHDWTHPGFPADVKASGSASERWIRDFADRVGLHYNPLMEGADTWVATSKGRKWGGEYLCLGGLLEGEYVPEEFWVHYQNVRGVEVPEEHQQNFFTCSC